MATFWHNPNLVERVGGPLAQVRYRPTPVRWGELADGEKVYPTHVAQSDILRSKARFTAAIAGTGGGKTAIGPLWVAREIKRVEWELDHNLRTEPLLGLVVAPTYQIMARATAPTLVRTLEGTDFEGTYYEGKSRYYLPNDLGVIWLLSADNPLSLEAGQFDWAWLDEAGQLKYDAWVAVQGRLGQREAPALLTTTPYGMNWLYHKFFMPYRAGDRNYYVRQWSSHHNPAYPKTEYDRAKESMSDQRGAMRYDGLFVRMAGLVYPDFESCIVEPFDPPEGRKIGGIDFGFNNPFAGLCGTVDDDDVLWVWYERYKRRCTIGTHSKYLPRGVQWFADPSRPESIRELNVAGHLVRKATNDIEAGIDAVNARIYTGRLKISRACIAGIAESEEYHYPEKDDESVGEKPVEEFNHAMDAIRYMVMGLDRGKKVRNEQDPEVTTHKPGEVPDHDTAEGQAEALMRLRTDRPEDVAQWMMRRAA